MTAAQDINTDYVLPNGMTVAEALAAPGSPKTEPLMPVSPGETLADMLEERRISTVECARLSGLPMETVQGVLDGCLPVDTEIAGGLDTAVGGGEGFWLDHEDHYEAALRFHRQKRPRPQTRRQRTARRMPNTADAAALYG